MSKQQIKGRVVLTARQSDHFYNVVPERLSRCSLMKKASFWRASCCRITAVIVLISMAAAAASASEPTVSVGDQIVDISFKDIRYLRRTLGDFENKKAFVLICINTTCPVVQQYIPKLIRMEKAYRDEGVQFLALYTSDADSVLEMAEHAMRFDIPFPAVQDIDGACVRALGVCRTPEVAILDAQRVLRYRGRIDDEYRTGGAQPKTTQHTLQEAVDAVLSGTEVAVKQTTVDGCLISPPRQIQLQSGLTYANDVRPLIQTHCVECHRPGTEAPFSLAKYEDVAAQGAMIAEVVAEQRMPPWYAGPSHGRFTNARGMSTIERDIVASWVADGMPMGELPPEAEQSENPNEPASPWLIGEPDLVISMSESHELPAEGYIPYEYVTLPYKFPHDVWIQSIQILPDNPRVLHHCLLRGRLVDEAGVKHRFAISGKAPGTQPMDTAGTGVAVHIPKGTEFFLQIHYTSTGQPESCRISVGIRYYRGVVRKRMQNLLIDSLQFTIPAGAPHHKVAESATLRTNAIGFGLVAHMHLRGKQMSFVARYPDGTTEELLNVPNYNFDWQIGYEWELGQQTFPKGTEIEVVGHYDNSAFNPYNPDPTKPVQHGFQTYHEMLEGHVFYADADENLNLKVDPKTGKALLTWNQVWSHLRADVDPVLLAISIIDVLVVLTAMVYLVRRYRRGQVSAS